MHCHPVELEAIVAMPFDQIRPHAFGQVSVVLAVLDLAARVRRTNMPPAVTGVLRRHV